ncbi:MAG: pyrroline-5-carboxylate reductase [Spirochaetia bacterium]|jgi:pyrroline-5-carboxylate reductase|nr:pyrroline-5-carboxylate reductase [Spirochaetia bacterium]
MKIGIIGVGNMGAAIAEGMRKSFPEIVIGIMDTDINKAKQVVQTVSGKIFPADKYEDFCSYSDIIILAVKPQYLDGLLVKLSKFTKTNKIISVAAGKTISYFEEKTGSDNVIRFMPNIAATVSEAITAVSPGKNASEEFLKEAVSIAESIGKSIILSESQMSAFTGLSGSGIAYVLSFIHALALGGTEQGIPYDQSLKIAIQTVNGATAILNKDVHSGGRKENPINLLTKVISAGGTTIKGVQALEEGRMTATVMDAVKKASNRATELES